MQFAIPDPGGVGPADPTLRAARGPDPLIEIPPHPHPFRRVRGLNLVSTPGLLAPVANALPVSVILGVIGQALRVDRGNPMGAADALVLVSSILPQKLEDVLACLLAEPSARTLGPAVTFHSLDHFGCEVARVVSSLSGQPNPVYELLHADLYPLEPPGAVAGWVNALMVPGTGLSYADVASDPRGFLPHLGMLEFVLFGRNVSAQRDGPASPMRRGLDQITTHARAASLLSNTAVISPAVIMDWLLRTATPDHLHLLRERGVGIDRRDQVLRDRHHYTYGTAEQRLQLVTEWVVDEPYKSMYVNITAVLRDDPPPADARSALLRLVRATTRSATAVVQDVGVIPPLDLALRNHVQQLSGPAMLATSVSQRVAEVENQLGIRPPASHVSSSSTSVSSTTANLTGGGAVATIRADLYADELAAATGTPTWFAFEAALNAELLQPAPNSLRLHDIMMSSDVLGVQRLALALTDSSNMNLLKVSKALAKAVEAKRSFNFVASHFMICDLNTLQVTDPKLLSFRLGDRVTAAIQRGAFDEFDLVEDILIPVKTALMPNEDRPEYPDGLWDPSVPVLLDPYLTRLERLLHLPTVAPPLPPMVVMPVGALAPPMPQAPPFTSLRNLISTIASEHIDIVGAPSPFNADYLAQLKLFETTGFKEVAAEFHQVVVRPGNPAGVLLTSVLPPVSAARGILAEMRSTKAARRAESNTTPGISQMYRDYREGRLFNEKGGRDRSRSRSPSHERDPDRLYGPNGKKRATAGPPLGTAAKGKDTGAPGSKYASSVAHSPDNGRFWFVNSSGGRASPVYDYETLERIAGKTRYELDFPVLLTTRPKGQKMLVCNHSHLPDHRDENSAAHTPPFASFLQDVAQHFREPAASGSEAVGGPLAHRSRLARSKSPHPGDARRSHGRYPGNLGDRLDPPREESPPRSEQTTRRTSRSRSRSSSPSRERGDSSPDSASERKRSRSASPRSRNAGKQSMPPGRDNEEKGKDAAAKPARDTPAANKPIPPAKASVSKTGRGDRSSKSPDRQRGGKRHATWATALLGAAGAKTADGAPIPRPVPPLIDLTLPAAAVVRTLLFVIALVPDQPAMILTPPAIAHVLGIARSEAAPRTAALSDAHRIADALGIPSVDSKLSCIPAFETIPPAGSAHAVVDRIVALPLGGSAAAAAAGWTEAMPGWRWLTLSALACATVYALAAMAVSRVRTYFPTSSGAVLRALAQAPAGWRSGARQARQIKRDRDALGPTQETHSRGGKFGTWAEARIFAAAADRALALALLAVPDDEPGAADLHAFADLIRPLNEEEVPLNFREDGALPSFSDPRLLLAPFSVRVQPPYTQRLPPPAAQRAPPESFKPQSFADLLTRGWLDRVVDWYCRFGEWMIQLGEAAASEDEEAVSAALAARPEVLVVPRSGFVPDARDIWWDNRSGIPQPLDTVAPIETHLNLDLIREWARRWSDWPDQELFSHLLEGVRFKVEMPFQLVLQPHLTSLPRGFVNVHKELVRLMEKGWFRQFAYPPFLPWFTLPMGVAFRKLEPERPRRTTDGGAPRKGTNGSDWMVDSDGVRVIPLNVRSRWPQEDIDRGTAEIFFSSWTKRLTSRPNAPPLAHVATGNWREGVPDAPAKPVLLAFSGPGTSPDSLARQIEVRGIPVEEIDVELGGRDHDLSDEGVAGKLEESIAGGKYLAVIIMVVCTSFSIAPGNDRPMLRTRRSPWGAANAPTSWRAYLRHHNLLAKAAIRLIRAATAASVDWLVENPSARWDRESPAYWSDYEEWGTFWDILISERIAPPRHLPPGTTSTVGEVLEAIFAACRFGSPHQKYTTFWGSAGFVALMIYFNGKFCVCRAGFHVRIRGRDRHGVSRAAAAAVYTPGVAKGMADGVQTLAFTASLGHETSASSTRRPTVGTRAAAPSLRTGRIIDVDITRSSPTFLLSNPFMMGPRGTDERFRLLALSLYREWLWMRTAAAQDVPSSLPVAERMRHVTGDDVVGEVSRLVRRHGRDALIHLVCGRRCYGRQCHGHELARLFQQIMDSSCDPPFPKEVKPSVADIMNDLAILMYVSQNTGLPLYQLVTDVKDFFNQHKLSPADVNKVGLVTLDPRAIVEHAGRLRDAEPELCSVAEEVLGYGIFSASNICQRHAILLIFVWSVEMLKESEPIVRALTRQHPFIHNFLEQRRIHLEPEVAGSECQRIRFLQARLWTAHMYTDDGHFAILSVELMVCGIKVWRRLTGELRLTMAIIQKHGLGTLVTHQGFRFHTGLGIVYVPEDKLRRALTQIDLALSGGIDLDDYLSLLGLLQSMLFVMGMRKASTYGLYGPFSGRLIVEPGERLRLSSVIREMLEVWRLKLCRRAGSPFTAAIDSLLDDAQDALEDAPVVFFLRSDACNPERERPGATSEGTVPEKEARDEPGLGGALGGHVWRYQLEGEECELPIAVLEFAAYYGEIEIHAPMIPTGTCVLSEVDALSTADALTTDAAASEYMQLIHAELLKMKEFVRIADRHLIAQVFGEANVMADAVSRKRWKVVYALAQQLGLHVEIVEAGPLLRRLMSKLVALRRTIAARGKPFSCSTDGDGPSNRPCMDSYPYHVFTRCLICDGVTPCVICGVPYELVFPITLQPLCPGSCVSPAAMSDLQSCRRASGTSTSLPHHATCARVLLLTNLFSRPRPPHHAHGNESQEVIQFMSTRPSSPSPEFDHALDQTLMQAANLLAELAPMVEPSVPYATRQATTGRCGCRRAEQHGGCQMPSVCARPDNHPVPCLDCMGVPSGSIEELMTVSLATPDPVAITSHMLALPRRQWLTCRCLCFACSLARRRECSYRSTTTADLIPNEVASDSSSRHSTDDTGVANGSDDGQLEDLSEDIVDLTRQSSSDLPAQLPYQRIPAMCTCDGIDGNGCRRLADLRLGRPFRCPDCFPHHEIGVRCNCECDTCALSDDTLAEPIATRSVSDEFAPSQHACTNADDSVEGPIVPPVNAAAANPPIAAAISVVTGTSPDMPAHGETVVSTSESASPFEPGPRRVRFCHCGYCGLEGGCHNVATRRQGFCHDCTQSWCRCTCEYLIDADIPAAQHAQRDASSDSGTTETLPPPRPQQPPTDGWRPTCLTDMLRPNAVRQTRAALANIHAWHTAQLAGFDTQRPHPLALGASTFQPRAHQHIWDLRDYRADNSGVPVLLNTTAPPSHLRVDRMEQLHDGHSETASDSSSSMDTLPAPYDDDDSFLVSLPLTPPLDAPAIALSTNRPPTAQPTPPDAGTLALWRRMDERESIYLNALWAQYVGILADHTDRPAASCTHAFTAHRPTHHAYGNESQEVIQFAASPLQPGAWHIFIEPEPTDDRICACPRGCTLPLFGGEQFCDFCFFEEGQPYPFCECYCNACQLSPIPSDGEDGSDSDDSDPTTSTLSDNDHDGAEQSSFCEDCELEASPRESDTADMPASYPAADAQAERPCLCPKDPCQLSVGSSESYCLLCCFEDWQDPAACTCFCDGCDASTSDEGVDGSIAQAAEPASCADFDAGAHRECIDHCCTTFPSNQSARLHPPRHAGRRVRTTAQTQRGNHNLNMVGSPIAHMEMLRAVMGGLADDYHCDASSAGVVDVMFDSAAVFPATAARTMDWYQQQGTTETPYVSLQAMGHDNVIAPPMLAAAPLTPQFPHPAGPAADRTAAHEIARLLEADTSSLALRPSHFSVTDLCERLYDPTTAQPPRTSKGQNSAWRHWDAWCKANNTEPWRLTRHTSDTEHHREAVLQAGFLRFCHVRQSARPRNGRRAALVSSAVKTLCHIRKMHRDRDFPMCSSRLVNTEARRLHFEYRSRFGVTDMVPKRKEPFTREIIETVILGAQSGLNLGFGTLDWGARHGRSLRGLTTTLAQTGFRKVEVSMHRVQQVCDVSCLSRASLTWFLRGKLYAVGQAPAEYLNNPRDGDFAILTPPPSKSDPFDMVWGGNPIWLPFQSGELLCAFVALAAIEINDPIGDANPAELAVFTHDDGTPFSEGQLDEALRRILAARLPPATVRLYSWHSMRIFLATMLLESGASFAQIRALCRWQTDDSILIYARLNSLKYKTLLDNAMRAKVTTARANNLAAAVPFIDLNDIYSATAHQQHFAAADAPDLDLEVHPDDDADDDGMDDDDTTTPTAQPTPVARSPMTRSTPRVVDAGDDGVVQLADDDPLSLADTHVTLPNKLWPEDADSTSSTRSLILGPLHQDTDRYAVLVAGFTYLFHIRELVTFLPTSHRSRVRALLRRAH